MDEVKVRKSQLVEVVRKNRSEHQSQFEKAFEGYRVTCLEVLEENLAKLRERKFTKIWITEAPPENHTRDYDRLLTMLEMSVDDEIKLSSEAFQQYVMDDWRWKDAWMTSNSKYLDKPRR